MKKMKDKNPLQLDYLLYIDICMVSNQIKDKNMFKILSKALNITTLDNFI